MIDSTYICKLLAKLNNKVKMETIEEKLASKGNFEVKKQSIGDKNKERMFLCPSIKPGDPAFIQNLSIECSTQKIEIDTLNPVSYFNSEPSSIFLEATMIKMT